MKIKLSLLIVVLFASAAYAQHEPAAIKYWIFLKDKQNGFGKIAEVEPDYLTLYARERRIRRASYSSRERDVPVSSLYVKELQNYGVEAIVKSRWLNAVSASITESQIPVISALPFVASIRPVARLEPTMDAAPPPIVEAPLLPDIRSTHRLDYGPSITQLEIANAVPPLEAGLKGDGVILGIIDTGMGDLPETHPATAVMIQEGRFIESQDFTGQPPDGSRHAYSVLSVAAGFDPGQLIGPAYGATVYHARTEYWPTETNQEEDNFVAGIEWMEAQGVDVVNISLGYSTFDDGQSSYSVTDLDGETGITTLAADMAVEMGVVVVVSAGNSGCSSPTICWYYVTMPADGDNVIAVGAVNADNNLVSFSSRGPTADGRIKPDVMAQGSSVYIANSTGAYSNGSGTSFSSPMVAGVVALMLEANPDLTPEQVRTILRNTADQAENPDDTFGWGIVDAEAAVREAQNLKFGTDTEPDARPGTFVIENLFPNPAFSEIQLQVNNEGPSTPARITVYDSQGRMVATAFESLLNPGRYTIPIDLNEWASGLYLYRLEAGGIRQTGKFVKL